MNSTTAETQLFGTGHTPPGSTPEVANPFTPGAQPVTPLIFEGWISSTPGEKRGIVFSVVRGSSTNAQQEILVFGAARLSSTKIADRYVSVERSPASAQALYFWQETPGVVATINAIALSSSEVERFVAGLTFQNLHPSKPIGVIPVIP